MALPATESFTDSNGVQLTTHSASWTLNDEDFDIQSNAFATDAASTGYCSAHWNADSFSDDQYSQIVVDAVVVNKYCYIGTSARNHASTADYYYWVGQANESLLGKVVSGSSTQLGAAGAAWVVTDVIKLEAEGTTITPYENGSTTGTPGAQTDAAHGSGYAGIGGYWHAPHSGFDDDIRGDDWEGGNLAAGAAAPTGQIEGPLYGPLGGPI